MPSSAGSSTSARARCSISAWLVLLMSSLVQAKWTNSAAAFSSRCGSARPSKRPLSQYSTAFTSWLVVASMSLMARASASEKRSTIPRSMPRAASVSGLNSAQPGVRQRDEPLDLDLHAAVHQSELAQQRAQRGHLRRVAAVERREGGEGRQVHGGRDVRAPDSEAPGGDSRLTLAERLLPNPRCASPPRTAGWPEHAPHPKPNRGDPMTFTRRHALLGTLAAAALAATSARPRPRASSRSPPSTPCRSSSSGSAASTRR